MNIRNMSASGSAASKHYSWDDRILILVIFDQSCPLLLSSFSCRFTPQILVTCWALTKRPVVPSDHWSFYTAQMAGFIFFLFLLIFLPYFSRSHKSDTDDYFLVNIRRVPMVMIEVLSDDEDHLKREMTDSSSIYSLELFLEPLNKRWTQFAVVLLLNQPWRTTTSDITCPGKNGLCTEEDILQARRIHLQLTKTSDCGQGKKDGKPLKITHLKLLYTVKDKQQQWRSVHFNVSDVQVEDPCNVNAQPTDFPVTPVFTDGVDCASAQPLTKADPFRGFYLRDGEFVNTTWCEHTCTCRNGNLLCKSLECSTRYNPNTERAVLMAGECCQLVEKRDSFDEEQCKKVEEEEWPMSDDPQRKMLIQLFRMPLWTVPYVVVHRPSYMSICMASFIHKRWLVTPANCLYYDGKSAKASQVIFGTTFFRVRLKRLLIHPEFSPIQPHSPVGDIAMFELDVDHPFGTYQQVINLPTIQQCGEFLRSNCSMMATVYGNDVSEYLFGMSSTLGVKTSRFPFPRHVIARLAVVDKEGGNPEDHLIKVNFTENSHRAGIPLEAGCVSADGSGLILRQGSAAHYLVGMVTPTQKGTAGANNGQSMCHEMSPYVVTICPYLDWIRLMMTLP